MEKRRKPKCDPSRSMASPARQPPAMVQVSKTPEQFKAARKLLQWSQERLGAMSTTSAYPVIVYEHKGHIAKVYGQLLTANPVDIIQATLEAVGIEVIEG